MIKTLKALIFALTFLFLVTAQANNANADITTGLIGHWTFEEGAGTTTTDQTASAEEMTLGAGATWGAGEIGSGALVTSTPGTGVNLAETTGSGSDISQLNLGLSDFTSCFWFKDTDADGDTFTGKGYADGSGGWEISRDGAGIINLSFNDSGTQYDYISYDNSAMSNDGIWHHYCVVASRSGWGRLYIDATLEKLRDISARSALDLTITNKFSLGSSLTAMDDVRIYNRALSPDDITELYMSDISSCPISHIDNFNTPGDAITVWGDGTYIYVADIAGDLRAYTFNGTAFTEVGTYTTTPNSVYDVWGDGTYIYIADGTSGVRAYTFNGTTFTEVGSYNTAGSAYGVWGDGTYIYVADGTIGLRVLSFNGTTFTNIDSAASSGGTALRIWGDGTYIYVIDISNGLSAFSFDGTTLTNLAIVQQVAATEYDVWGDGSYIYAADGPYGLVAYTFDGTAFTKITYLSSTTDVKDVWGDGTYIYIADHTGGIRAYIFNGTSFLPQKFDTTSTTAYGVWGDGTYLYTADRTVGIRAYSACIAPPPPSSGCSSPTGIGGVMIYNDDENIMQYCNGTDWIGIR